MADALETLTAILPPPSTPDDNHGDWKSIEAKLATRLPDDYKAFVELYGTGAITTDIGGDVLWVLNPFSRNEFRDMVNAVRGLESYVRTRGTTTYVEEFQVFPMGKLLIWGRNIDGDQMFWRTGLEPLEWTVVADDRCRSRFYEYPDQSFSTFLVNLVRGRLDGYKLRKGEIKFQTASQVAHSYGED